MLVNCFHHFFCTSPFCVGVSHEEGDVEKTLAVYGAKSHHARAVRKATRDPLITNKFEPIGCAQFEPSWLVDREAPRGARRSRKPKARCRMTGVLLWQKKIVELPSHSSAVLNVLECFFVNYVMSHPLLYSAIRSPPIIASFNSQLPGADLPPGSFAGAARMLAWAHGHWPWESHVSLSPLLFFLVIFFRKVASDDVASRAGAGIGAA